MSYMNKSFHFVSFQLAKPKHSAKLSLNRGDPVFHSIFAYKSIPWSSSRGPHRSTHLSHHRLKPSSAFVTVMNQYVFADYFSRTFLQKSTCAHLRLLRLALRCRFVRLIKASSQATDQECLTPSQYRHPKFLFPCLVLITLTTTNQ